MIDDEVKIISIALILAMGAIAAYPLISTRVIIEPHSEIGVLGPNGVIGDYPTNIKTGDPINLFIHVGNNEGRVKYYRVIVRLVPENHSDTAVANLQIIDTLDLFLIGGESRELPLNFSISQPSNNLRINFDLYTYDPGMHSFAYRMRAQLWLSVT
jgi:uncharacterized membrane protein